MLVALPEVETQPRRALSSITGPAVAVHQLAPEKRKLVHLLELGKIEAPVLWVEAQTLRLIQLELPGLDPKENLQNYLVYKLGAFSTVPVKLVQLTASQRGLNATMMRQVTTTTTTDLQQLTSDEDAGPTEALDDEDLDEDEDYPEPLEEEEDPL
jgi:hypothetical protein